MDAKSKRRNRLILLGGGSRSGKSAFALDLARGLGQRRLFIATAQAGDEEMADRIRHHRLQRGQEFFTIEEPLAISTILRKQASFEVVVLDCLTLWLTNLLLQGNTVEAILGKVEDLLAALKSWPGHALVITNEVGLGLVPETSLGRNFRDLAGLAHQRISRSADEVYFAILGTILRIKPDLTPVDWREPIL